MRIASWKFMQLTIICKYNCVHGFDRSIDVILWCNYQNVGAMHFIYQINRLTTSRFNLFGLISQHSTTYMSVERLERMTTGSVAKRLILSRHTGRRWQIILWLKIGLLLFAESQYTAE